MMASAIDIAYRLIKFDDYDHDAAEEEYWSRDNSELTHEELKHLLPDDLYDDIVNNYHDTYKDDPEHHESAEYYDPDGTIAMPRHIENTLDDMQQYHLDNGEDAPDYIKDWQAARDEKIKTYDWDNWEPTFDVNEFGRKNWEWDDESQNMVLRGEPIEMVFQLLKDNSNIN